MCEIVNVKFDGFDAIELTTSKLKVVAVFEVGPRIAYFGTPDGKNNLLYWDKDGGSKDGWKLYGGHRVWLTRPMADESEDTYAEDNLPCDVEIDRDGFTVTAPTHEFTKLKRGITVRYISEDRIEVTNHIENAGNFIYSGGVWSPTCINPHDKVIRVPLGEDSSWDIVKIVIPRIFGGNRVRLDDPQVTFEGDEMVLRSQGVLTKRCVSAPKGIIRMECPAEKLVFEKQSNYIEGAKYPLDGCNLAVFVGQDNWMGEMESFGVEQPIKPGDTIHNREEWTLSELS